MEQARKQAQRTKSKVARVRAKVFGTATRPRLAVSISSRHIRAQIIDDNLGRTLVASSSVGAKQAVSTMREKANLVGAEVALKAKESKIKQVVFDRRARRYHGLVEITAETARQNGLEF